MKGVILFIIANCLLLIACHKKAAPVITERKVDRTMRNTDTLYRQADTVLGKSLLATRCSGCHGTPELTQFNKAKWELIIARMAPRAKLTAQETYDLLSYIKHHAAASM